MASKIVDDSGGGASAYTADTALIRAAGISLAEGSRWLTSARTDGPIAGVGEARAIEEAVARFRATWAQPLTQWSSALVTFGDSVAAVATMLETSDAQAASPWQCLAGGLPR